MKIPDSYNEKLSDTIKELRDKEVDTLREMREFLKEDKISKYLEKYDEYSKYMKMERLYFKILGLTPNGKKHLLELYVPQPKDAPRIIKRA